MSETDQKRVVELKSVIADFLKRRLDEKLEKIKGIDDASDAARRKERERFSQEAWLSSAAQRSDQIQLVTHVLKATHPELSIKVATNLYVKPQSLTPCDLVGSHVLGQDFTDDATGNAAALDIYDFLTQKYDDRTILDLALVSDVDLAAALNDDSAKATQWVQAFAKVVESPCDQPTSHTLAKQIYWLTGDDPHENSSFHLLGPLYASSLAHRVYLTLQDDRFSDEAKAAREAKRAGVFSERPVREYPHLAMQQLGGTKPQNISQLNSKRRGNNGLLASLPPVWKSVDLKPIYGTSSMFHRYGWRDQVRRTLRALREFLKTDPLRNRETRQHRADLIDELIDEFLQFTAELRTLAPGWSQAGECQLSLAEKDWLDHDGLVQDFELTKRALPSDTPELISSAFANWLNARLRDPLPVGDTEFLEWRNRMLEQIKADERGGREDE